MPSINENDMDHCYNVNLANQEYRANRECLVNLHTETKTAFLEITDILKPSTLDVLECIKIEDLSIGISELGVSNETNENILNVENIDISNPAIAILGQLKAGKSTFVNVLLRKNVVRQDYERCTARLTRLTYSKINYVELLDGDGNILKRKNLKNSKIPKSYVKLNEQDRQNMDEIKKEVKAGIKCQFLKNGIDIIDTPGLSEHSTLSNLSKDMVKHILPVMIYVIDGCTSVKQTDICDLYELKNAVPNLQIIYFISKLDSDEIETEVKDPYELESIKIKIANEKLLFAFKKLQHNNLISKNFNDWKECPNFHGASLYCYMDYLKNIKNRENTFHCEMFNRFESYLSQCLLIHFENKIVTASNSLIYFHMDVLTKIINRGQILKDFSDENLNQIECIKILENNIFEHIKDIINLSKSNFKNMLINKLKSDKEMIYQIVRESHYPVSFGIPQSGMIIDCKTVDICRHYIINVICQGFEHIIQEFVEHELYNKYRMKIENQISERMKIKLNMEQSKLFGYNPYSMCLKRILTENYRHNFSNSYRKFETQTILSGFFNVIITVLKEFLWEMFQINSFRGCVDVNSFDWKDKQVKTCLEFCDYFLLAENVCLNLVEDFQMKHDNFITALEAEERYMQKQFQISDAIRCELIKQKPKFTNLLMKTLDIKGRYMLKELKKEEEIGRGAQGVVYQCSLNGKYLAKKSRNLPDKEFHLIAEEVYYSYLFEHPRLLPFIAISIKKINDQNYFNVSIYTPLMKTDVLNYITKNDTTLEDRLRIGLQTAEALQYLHNQQIMHRDLKLANILLDNDNNVYLADYGCCQSTGTANNTLVGTPIHMAPEIIKNHYNFKIDIYSFGILLWYLVEGKGNHPQHATMKKECFQVLFSAANGMRPERLKNMPNDLWDLMTSCWDENPNNRPNADSIIKSMELIIKNCSENRKS